MTQVISKVEALGLQQPITEPNLPKSFISVIWKYLCSWFLNLIKGGMKTLPHTSQLCMIAQGLYLLAHKFQGCLLQHDKGTRKHTVHGLAFYAGIHPEEVWIEQVPIHFVSISSIFFLVINFFSILSISFH